MNKRPIPALITIYIMGLYITLYMHFGGSSPIYLEQRDAALNPMCRVAIPSRPCSYCYVRVQSNPSILKEDKRVLIEPVGKTMVVVGRWETKIKVKPTVGRLTGPGDHIHLRLDNKAD